jgi:hypothetical protein
LNKYNNAIYRARLKKSALAIASRRGESPYSPWVAFRKIFIQEHRDCSKPNAPRIKWKRGELAEYLLARTPQERAEEWGDIGYYVAQSSNWLWWLYQAITPEKIISQAADKFERRSTS